MVGDTSVRGYITKNSCRANVSLKNAQVLSCGTLELFEDTLKKTRADSTACVIACLTGFLAAAEGSSFVGQRIGPLLEDVREVLLGVCEENPDRHYLLSPPMYQMSPVWYREGLPEILNIYSHCMSQEKPANLHLLPSFPTPEFDNAGVHLTPYAGLEFILHLFDSAGELLDRLSLPGQEKALLSCETTRVLEDRVMVLEQDHRRLNRVFETKSAADAELSDFRENEGFQDWFEISGLGSIPSELVGKAWQDQAVKDVQAVLTPLMGKEIKIVLVKNATTRQKDAIVTYNVQVEDIATSKAIRVKFGKFFLGSKDQRPDPFTGINIKMRMTPNTKIRISVLKLLAKRHKNANPSDRVQVISYDPRPMLKISPGPESTDKRVRSYNYVEAVQVLPTNFTNEEIYPILRRINPKLTGLVRTIFVALSDDDFRKATSRFTRREPDQVGVPVGQVAQVPAGAGVAPAVPATSGKGSRKRGATTEQSGPSKK